MHHAWLIGGPNGVGKATFARAAAIRLLSEAAGHVSPESDLEVDPEIPTARFIAGQAHPDFRYVERGLNKTGSALARNITVDQIRELASLFDSTPALSNWRVAVIDSVDDLEPGGANALLKMLEEPPSNCLFLLVSHVPGRLLPTIRSRCRTLTFQALGQTCTPTGAIQAAAYSDSFNNFSPALTVAYKANEDLNLYAKFARGYKSGGTSQRSANPINFAAGYEPEKVDSYEAGIKGN